MEVTVVIPTYNEEENIARLLSHFNFADRNLQYETIVVDDSTDKTAEAASRMKAKVIKGKGQGLGQAIIDGIEASTGDIVVVMDADGSHNPLDIPKLIKPILEQGYDMTIGSRYVKEGSLGNWSLKRKLQSIIGVKIMQLVIGVADSNSGFFAFRKEIIKDVELKPSSWKIMLEVLFKGNITSRKEIPIKFSERWAGESKNNLKEKIRQAKHILRLLIFERFYRYIRFAIVGGVGALWYFGFLYYLTEYQHLWYMLSAVIATVIASTNNYLLNHFITFRKSKSENKNIFKGWGKYQTTSWIGDGLDLLVLFALTEFIGLWYMLSALLASAMASGIKYTIVKQWVWGKKRKASDFDYEWGSYYKGMIFQKWWKQKIAGAVRKLAGSAGKVLDIGCGSSPAGVLTDHTNYTGLDINQGKIEFMQNKILANATFNVGSATELPYEPNNFDTILFIEVIEHLNNWDEVQKALGEISRVLKVGGTAIIATPNFGSLIGKIQDKLYNKFQPSAYGKEHKIKFTPNSLEKICSNYNLIFQESVIPLSSDMVCKFKKSHGTT